MKVVALIPARGGSKGIPRKNLVAVGGRPLIAHTIACARAVPEMDGVFVSTDDDEIAACAESHGASAPFRRPAEAAHDEAPMIAVLRHFLDWSDANGVGADAIVLLQPTSPLRKPASVTRAIEIFRTQPADSVVSVCRVPHNCTPGSLLRVLGDGRVEPAFPSENSTLRRQDKPVLFARNGPAVLVLGRKIIAEGRLYSDRTYAFEMNRLESFDVDDPDDLPIAGALLSAGL